MRRPHRRRTTTVPVIIMAHRTGITARAPCTMDRGIIARTTDRTSDLTVTGKRQRPGSTRAFSSIGHVRAELPPAVSIESSGAVDQYPRPMIPFQGPLFLSSSGPFWSQRAGIVKKARPPIKAADQSMGGTQRFGAAYPERRLPANSVMAQRSNCLTPSTDRPRGEKSPPLAAMARARS